MTTPSAPLSRADLDGLIDDALAEQAAARRHLQMTSLASIGFWFGNEAPEAADHLGVDGDVITVLDAAGKPLTCDITPLLLLLSLDRHSDEARAAGLHLGPDDSITFYRDDAEAALTKLVGNGANVSPNGTAWSARATAQAGLELADRVAELDKALSDSVHPDAGPDPQQAIRIDQLQFEIATLVTEHPAHAADGPLLPQTDVPAYLLEPGMPGSVLNISRVDPVFWFDCDEPEDVIAMPTGVDGEGRIEAWVNVSSGEPLNSVATLMLWHLQGLPVTDVEPAFNAVAGQVIFCGSGATGLTDSELELIRGLQAQYQPPNDSLTRSGINAHTLASPAVEERESQADQNSAVGLYDIDVVQAVISGAHLPATAGGAESLPGSTAIGADPSAQEVSAEGAGVDGPS